MLVRALKPFRAPHKMVQPGEVFDTDSNHANELLRNGLAVAHKMKLTPSNKAAPTPQNKADAGKAPAGGEAQQSSVSQAAQASLLPTATPSADGEKRPTLRLRKTRAKRSP